jgi:hypothetical protein
MNDYDNDRLFDIDDAFDFLSLAFFACLFGGALTAALSM